MQGVSGRMGGGMPGQASQSVADIVKEAKECEDLGYDVYQTRSTNREALEAVRNATDLIIMVYLSYAAFGTARIRVTSGSDTRISPLPRNWKRPLKM